MADKLGGGRRERKEMSHGGSRLGSRPNQTQDQKRRVSQSENNSRRQRRDDYARLNIVSGAERVIPMVEQLRGMPPHTSREDQQPRKMDKLAPHSDNWMPPGASQSREKFENNRETLSQPSKMIAHDDVLPLTPVLATLSPVPPRAAWHCPRHVPGVLPEPESGVHGMVQARADPWRPRRRHRDSLSPVR